MTDLKTVLKGMSMAAAFEAVKEMLGVAETVRDTALGNVDDLRAEVTDKTAAIEVLTEQYGMEREAMQAKLQAAAEVIEARDMAIDSIKAELDTAKAKLELAPYKDTTGSGTAVLGDDAAGNDANGKDILAQMNACETNTDKIAFYRAHKAEIDAAWNAK